MALESLRKDIVVTFRRLGLWIAVGSVMSVLLFILDITVAANSKDDAGVVDSLGRLRYHTQNLGIIILAKELAHRDEYHPPEKFDVNSPADTVASISKLCAALLGRNSDPNSALDVPEIVDDSVKQMLESWQKAIADIIALKNAQVDGGVSSTDVFSAIDKVNEATMSMESIVVAASNGANRRIRLLFNVSICRLVFGIFYGLVFWRLIGKIWVSSIHCYNSLALEMEREQSALLRACFDAIIQVSTEAPYKVLGSSSQFDHFVGKSMKGESILDCCLNQDETKKLSGQFDMQAVSTEPTSQWRWSDMWLPRAKVESLPTAAVLRSQWRCGVCAFDVELFLVHSSGRPTGMRSFLLAVRQSPAPDDKNGNPNEKVPPPLEDSLPCFSETVRYNIPNIVGKHSSQKWASSACGSDSLEPKIVGKHSKSASRACGSLSLEPKIIGRCSSQKSSSSPCASQSFIGRQSSRKSASSACSSQSLETISEDDTTVNEADAWMSTFNATWALSHVSDSFGFMGGASEVDAWLLTLTISNGVVTAADDTTQNLVREHGVVRFNRSVIFVRDGTLYLQPHDAPDGLVFVYEQKEQESSVGVTHDQTPMYRPQPTFGPMLLHLNSQSASGSSSSSNHTWMSEGSSVARNGQRYTPPTGTSAPPGVIDGMV